MYWKIALATFSACGMLTLPLHAEEPDPAQIAEARAAAKDLGQGLKAQLIAAIKAGGPVSAIGVCQIVAPALSKQSGGTHGLKVGRTALRIRNPANAPDAYERRVLEDFVAQINAGASADKLESAEVILDEGTPVFRYMKAIPMGTQPCLTCHGSDIDPALKAEIGRLYPDDEAIGFKPGQLRGAFTVSGKAQ